MSKRRVPGPWLMAVGLGFEFVGLVLGAVFLGSWLDARYQTGSTFVLIGLVLALVVAFWQVWRVAQAQIRTWDDDGVSTHDEG